MPRRVRKHSRGVVTTARAGVPVATVTLYANGLTMGTGNPRPVGGKRSEVKGWSRASVRRLLKWLYAVNANDLRGQGTALTLTLQADNVPTQPEWARLIKTMGMWLAVQPGYVGHCYVVEFTRRKVPHLHLAVYNDRQASEVVGQRLIAWWLAHTSATKSAAQRHLPITGPVGWLEYLSKHASRGVHHYQRQGMPLGWEKTGRLWGKGGSWPVEASLGLDLEREQWYTLRRWITAYAASEVRSRAIRTGNPDDWKALARVRRMRRVGDRSLSEVRGTSQWIPLEVTLRMATAAGWDGTVKDSTTST